MSYTSSYASTSSKSTSTSPSTSPSSARSIQIGFTPSGTDALLDIFPSASSSQSAQYSTCTAYPSWPSGSALKKATSRRPSAYLSDEDLFGDDDVPYMSDPPPEPRSAQVWAMAQPLLPPVTATRRRSSGHKEKKHRKSSTTSR